MINSAASLFVGAYLLVVVFNGKSVELYELLKGESGYVKWLLAALIVYGLANAESTKEIGRPLAIVAAAALFINAARDETLWRGFQTVIDFFEPKSEGAK